MLSISECSCLHSLVLALRTRRFLFMYWCKDGTGCSKDFRCSNLRSGGLRRAGTASCNISYLYQSANEFKTLVVWIISKFPVGKWTMRLASIRSSNGYLLILTPRTQLKFNNVKFSYFTNQDSLLLQGLGTVIFLQQYRVF